MMGASAQHRVVWGANAGLGVRFRLNTQGALVRAYSVTLVPTFVFFKGGREVSRQTGATTYEDLAGKLQALVAAP